MIDPEDITMDIKLTFTIPCGAGASPELVKEFADVVRADCRQRDGMGATFHGDVEVTPGGKDENLVNPGDDAGSVVASLSVRGVIDAKDLIDDVAEFAANWWDKYPVHPLPGQPAV